MKLPPITYLLIGLVLGLILIATGKLITKSTSLPAAISQPVIASKPSTLPNLNWQLVESAAAWGPRDAAAVFTWRDRLWLAGGLTGTPVATGGQVAYWTLPHHHDIWSTADGREWRQEVAAAAWPPLRSMSVVEFRGQLWLMGGWSSVTGYHTGIWVSDDAVSWQWVGRGAWPEREGQTVSVFNNQLVLTGGVNFDQRRSFNDVWVSDDGISWRELTPAAAWPARYDQAMEVWRGRLWVAGGIGVGQERAMSDVWSSADGLIWKQEVAIAPWGERHGEGLVAWQDKLWLVGGWQTAPDYPTTGNDVWFTADGVNWQKTSDQPVWAGREDHGVIVWRDQVWLLGGMDRDWTWRGDVWRTSLSPYFPAKSL
ncbi:MAG: hypothetical protein AAB468_01245 [Patescibacteria group bacterium]